jgi:hypothetical protein
MGLKFKLRTVDDVLYIADGKTERLLINVRGRGWFMSCGETAERHLTPSRMGRWIKESPESFERVSVEHFHFEEAKR